MSDWEEYLKIVEPKDWKMAVIHVTDTIQNCIQFWERYRPEMKPTPTDIIEMAKMIIDMKRETK